MSTVPEQTWSSSATTWNALITRYVTHLQVPSWRGKALHADGSPTLGAISGPQAKLLQEKLLAAVSPLLQAGTMSEPPEPTFIEAVLVQEGHAGRRFDKCPTTVWHLWRAFTFNRDRYTCRYCRRSTWAVYAVEGRGLRFELDHLTARAALADSDDFAAANIVTACRSCNAMKGQMDVERFECELLSLAESVVTHRRPQRC